MNYIPRVSWEFSPENENFVCDILRLIDNLRQEQEASDKIVLAPYITLLPNEYDRTLLIFIDALKRMKDTIDSQNLSEFQKIKMYEVGKKNLHIRWKGSMSTVINNFRIKHPEIKNLFPCNSGNSGSNDMFVLADFSKRFFEDRRFYSDKFIERGLEPMELDFYKSKGYIYVTDLREAIKVLGFYAQHVISLENRQKLYEPSRYFSPEEINTIVQHKTGKLMDFTHAIILGMLNRRRKMYTTKQYMKNWIISNKDINNHLSPKVFEAAKEVNDRLKKGIDMSYIDLKSRYDLNENEILSCIFYVIIERLEKSVVNEIISLKGVCIESLLGYMISNSKESVEVYKNKLNKQCVMAEGFFNELKNDMTKSWPELHAMSIKDFIVPSSEEKY